MLTRGCSRSQLFRFYTAGVFACHNYLIVIINYLLLHLPSIQPFIEKKSVRIKGLPLLLLLLLLLPASPA